MLMYTTRYNDITLKRYLQGPHYSNLKYKEQEVDRYGSSQMLFVYIRIIQTNQSSQEQKKHTTLHKAVKGGGQNTWQIDHEEKKTNFQYKEELLLRLDHLVEFADVLVTEFLQRLDLCSNSWQIITQRFLVHDLNGNFITSGYVKTKFDFCKTTYQNKRPVNTL